MRTLAFSTVPFGWSVFIFVPGAAFEVTLVSMGLLLLSTTLATQTVLQSSFPHALGANVIGFFLWSAVLSELMSRQDLYAPAVFLWELGGCSALFTPYPLAPFLTTCGRAPWLSPLWEREKEEPFHYFPSPLAPLPSSQEGRGGPDRARETEGDVSYKVTDREWRGTTLGVGFDAGKARRLRAHAWSDELGGSATAEGQRSATVGCTERGPTVRAPSTAISGQASGPTLGTNGIRQAQDERTDILTPGGPVRSWPFDRLRMSGLTF